MSVFVHAQGIKTVHVVVECPLKVHSFLKQVMHNLCFTKKVVLSPNLSTQPQLTSAECFGKRSRKH